MVNLCSDCRKDFAICGENPSFGCDNGGKLSDDNVVKCDKYITNRKGWECPSCGYDGFDNGPYDTFCTSCRKHR